MRFKVMLLFLVFACEQLTANRGCERTHKAALGITAGSFPIDQLRVGETYRIWLYGRSIWAAYLGRSPSGGVLLQSRSGDFEVPVDHINWEHSEVPSPRIAMARQRAFELGAAPSSQATLPLGETKLKPTLHPHRHELVIRERGEPAESSVIELTVPVSRVHVREQNWALQLEVGKRYVFPSKSGNRYPATLRRVNVHSNELVVTLHEGLFGMKDSDGVLRIERIDWETLRKDLGN